MTPPLSDASPANSSFQYHFSDEDLREFSWQLDDPHHAPAARNHHAEVPAVASTVVASTASTNTSAELPTSTTISRTSLMSPGMAHKQLEQHFSMLPASKPDPARAQRKRSREKQRRSDINNQFSDLQQTLRSIEMERNSTCVIQANNRVDLIARTKTLLEELHVESKKLKAENENLEKEAAENKKIAEDTAARLKEATLYHPGAAAQKPVMMMVPMMMPTNAAAAAATGGTPAVASGAASAVATTTPPSSSGAETPVAAAPTSAVPSAAAMQPAFAMPHAFMPSPFMVQPGMMHPGMQHHPMSFMHAPVPVPPQQPPSSSDGQVTTAITPPVAAPATGSPVWKGVSGSAPGGNLAHCA